jgi:hypothetical protein
MITIKPIQTELQDLLELIRLPDTDIELCLEQAYRRGVRAGIARHKKLFQELLISNGLIDLTNKQNGND